MKKLLLILVLQLLANFTYAQCNPDVGAPIQYLCSSNSLTLTASSGYTSYLWSTGATTSSIVVTKPGTYTVKIVGSGNCLVFKSVEVLRPGKAKFSVSGSAKCDSSSYLFTNQSSISFANLQSFRWDFGDDSVYQSASPPNPVTDLARWTNFTYKYRKGGSFDPKLSLTYQGQACADNFAYSESGDELPQNIQIKIDIRSRVSKNNNTPKDSLCYDQPLLCLYNKYPLVAKGGVSFLWDFADPSAMGMGFDKLFNDTAPCYNYGRLGHYFPTLTITCAGQGSKTFNFWSRIDTLGGSDHQYNPAPQSNPRINTINGMLYGASDSISRYRIITGNNNSIKDSIVDHWNWFSNNPSLAGNKKLRSQLKGYGVNIIGTINKVENLSANPPVAIQNIMKNQCDPVLPIEFVNASETYQTTKLFMRWDFANQFAPRCTSFALPNPNTPNGGKAPYTSANDLMNRTYGTFTFNGVTYAGRANCNYSKDTLPIHQYESWDKLYKWYLNGHDFPPYDSSATGWTKVPAQVTPGGKKLVQTVDFASWGLPVFSAGPFTTRMDVLNNLWPADLQPNTPITTTKAIPDPIANEYGYWEYTIPAGTRVDSNGFLVPPIPGFLPNGVNRSLYKGNSKIASLNKNLYAYFFDRTISSCYKVKLFEQDSLNGCGNESVVDLPLVKADAFGLGKGGNECPGMPMNGGVGTPKIVFDNSAGNPGTYPNCSKRTMVLLNYDSLADRNDAMPCALDGFVSFDGISPMTGTTTTPGGNTWPAFYNRPNFQPFQGGPWTDPNGAVNWTHYQPDGPWPYTNSPFDKKTGYVTIGLILGSGCATPACNTPACITDTVWYHNFFQFIYLDGNFTYRKVGGYPQYGSTSKLPSQDFSYDTASVFLKNNPLGFPPVIYEPNQGYREPWSRLYGKGDILEFETYTKVQDFIKADVWDWGDGTITVDSFYYNKFDTSVALDPIGNPTVFSFFEKNTYPVKRERYEFNVNSFPWTILSKTIPYPVGVKVNKSVKYDTIWRCDDVMHIYPPLKIKVINQIVDTAFFLQPVRHQFKVSSMERFAGPGTTIKANDITPVQHTVVSVNKCNYNTIKRIVIGVMDTFTVKEGNAISDGFLQIGQTVSFEDSVRYWYPKSWGRHNPTRPLYIGEEELLTELDFHGNAMKGYPIDTIKTAPNNTKAYSILGTTCPTGWQFYQEGANGGFHNFCIKIDTNFYERIYWDFESDGVIDYAGKNPSHKYMQSGTYIVSMISRDSVGYFDTVKTTLQVGGCGSFNPFPGMVSSCTDNAIVLEVGSDHILNKWYKNGTDSVIAENTLFLACKQEGTYRVETRNANNTCHYIDSVRVLLFAEAGIKQGSAITFCAKGKDSLVLQPSTLVGYQFLWDNTVNNPNLVIKQSEIRQKHVLKITKLGITCYDTITSSFIEPLKTVPGFSSLCIKDSLWVEVKSNAGKGAFINYTWFKDSLDAGITAASPHLFVYANAGMQKLKVVQHFETCRDSVMANVYTNSNSVPLNVTGLTSVKALDTATYHLPFVAGNAYAWNVTGGSIQSGQGSSSILVKWGNTLSLGKIEALVQNVFSCLDSSNLMVNIGSVGIKENKQIGFVLFPNPSTDKLTLSTLMGELFDGDMVVTDMAGRVFLEQNLTQKMQQVEINVSEIPAGLYLLRLNNEKGMIHFIFEKK
jgi:hypothetical protein